MNEETARRLCLFSLASRRARNNPPSTLATSQTCPRHKGRGFNVSSQPTPPLSFSVASLQLQASIHVIRAHRSSLSLCVCVCALMDRSIHFCSYRHSTGAGPAQIATQRKRHTKQQVSIFPSRLFIFYLSISIRVHTSVHLCLHVDTQQTHRSTARADGTTRDGHRSHADGRTVKETC